MRFLGDVQTYMINNQSIKTTLESFNASIVCNTLPERISNLVYENKTDKSVSLRWDEHSSLAAGIKFVHYRLIITTGKDETDKLSPNLKHTKKTHFKLNELEPSTHYKIKVLVVTTHGDSPESDVLDIKTDVNMEKNDTAEIFDQIVSTCIFFPSISCLYYFSKENIGFKDVTFKHLSFSLY